MIDVLYFASLREQVQCDREQLSLSEEAATVAGLKALLSARGGNWAELFTQDNRLLCALNQEMVNDDAPIRDHDEVAFFPPVTGG